ncbi:hypothetical protein F5888DRAFT_964701 [Russula emetica]|nr:hypothetical protein F5888DRAFT_964701 [Russula emetica]
MGFVEFWHALCGIYFWEFFNTLDYEWMVIRGYLPYRWSIWIYSLARVACLVAMILILIGMDVTTHISCQLWASSVATFFCLASAAASLLIVLRITAIWNRNRVVMVTSISVWLIGVAFRIQNAVRLRSAWDPTRLNCLSVTTTERGVLGVIPVISADISLLLIMLVGLVLLRRSGGCTFGLTLILWKQGTIWLLLAFVSEIPPAVMVVLNSNDQLDNMLLTPGLIAVAMTIAATRMHRSLVNLAYGFHDYAHEGHNQPIHIKQTQAASNRLDRIQVAVHKPFEPHPTAKMNDEDS